MIKLLPVTNTFSDLIQTNTFYGKTFQMVMAGDVNLPESRPLRLSDLGDSTLFTAQSDGNGVVYVTSYIDDFQVTSSNGNVTFNGTFHYSNEPFEYYLSGFTDDKRALMQTIFIILLTERYQFPIYSWDFGLETIDLYGKPIPFVMAELPRRIVDALMQDDRITTVTDFYFENPDRNKLQVFFTVESTIGNIEMEMGVVV